MSGQLAGKVAVVTGGASGIGLRTAERFAVEGAAVALLDRDEEAASAAAKTIDAEGARAIAVGADVTDADSLSAAASRVESELGPIDVLSCNAGLAAYPVPALEADPDEFDRILAVNVKGVWLSVRAVAPSMIAGGKGGSIVVTGSVMGVRARPGFGAYAASKAAANHLAKTLAVELAPHQIRVNALAPVACDTPMLPMFLGPEDPEGARAKFIGGIPLGRLAEPDDVAGAALFFASDASRFVTGTVLAVDGGRSV